MKALQKDVGRKSVEQREQQLNIETLSYQIGSVKSETQVRLSGNNVRVPFLYITSVSSREFCSFLYNYSVMCYTETRTIRDRVVREGHCKTKINDSSYVSQASDIVRLCWAGSVQTVRQDGPLTLFSCVLQPRSFIIQPKK